MKWIYLIKADFDDNVFYKIGIAKDPEKRIKNLQTGNSSKLEIVQLFKSNHVYSLEKVLHRTYLMDSIRGEWFRLDDSQVENFLIHCQKIENNLKLLSEYDKK